MVGEHQSNPSPWPVSSDPDVLDSEETKSKPIKQRLDRLKTNCHNNINLCAQICIPVFESYMCTCRQGFELEDDGTSCKEAKVRDRISGRADLASDIGIRSRVSTYYRLPKIVKLPTLLEYIEGDSAALACSAVGNPQPNVSWSRRSDTGGLEPLPADFHSDIGGNLAIERLKHSDEGDYLCEAENSLGNDSKVVTIRIKAPPKCFYQRGLCDAVCEEEGLSCSCPPGYRLTEISRQCKDIDECNGSSCPQICQNTPGSYTCSCEPEFRAGTDGLSCEPVQACGRNDLKCLPAYRITDGKKTCDCVEGFAYFQDVNTCFRESPPVFSLATMSPLFIALGAIGLTLVASGVITVGIVFIVGSRQDKD